MPRLAIRKQLTDITIAKAPTRAGRYEIADSVIDGLRLIVQPSGHRSFALRYTFARRYQKLTLGDFALPAFGIKAARAAAGKAQEAIGDGQDPNAAKRRGADPDGTVRAAVARYTAG